MKNFKTKIHRALSLLMAVTMLAGNVTVPQASPQLDEHVEFEYGSGAINSLKAKVRNYGYGFRYSPNRNATSLSQAYLIENREKDINKYVEFENAGYYIGADKKNHPVDMRLYIWDYQESEATDNERSHSFIWIDDDGHLRINSCSADGTYVGDAAETYHNLANSTNGGVFMEYHFFDATTKAEVDFTGMMTYKDIDGMQGNDGNIVNEGIAIDSGDAQVVLTDSTVIQRVERNGMEWYQGSMYTEDILGSDGHSQDDQKITLKFTSTANNPLRVVYRNNTVNGKLVSDYQQVIHNETVTITYKIPTANLPSLSSNADARTLIEEGGGEQQRFLNYGSDTASADAQAVLNIPAKEVNGYTFDGWYTSDEFTDASRWTGTDAQTGNLILYGRYVPKQYKITVRGQIEGNSEIKKFTEIPFAYGDKVAVKTYGIKHASNDKTYELQYAMVDGVRKEKTSLHPAGSNNLNTFYDKIARDVDVLYVYKEVDTTGWVKVEHYVEGTNERLEDGRFDETYYGPVGESVYVAPVTVPGWKVTAFESGGNISTSDLTERRQVYAASGVTVKFYYKPVSGGLTIRYVYEGDPEVPVTTSTELDGSPGEVIDTNAKRLEKEGRDNSFNGLEFIGAKVYQSGSYTICSPTDADFENIANIELGNNDEPKSITYVYRVKSTDIVVRHISKDSCNNNEVLLEEEPVHKQIGDLFVAKSQVFRGYDLIGDSGNTVYTVTDSDNGKTVTIDFYYQHEKHKLTTKYRDDKGAAFIYKAPSSEDIPYNDVVTGNIHYGQRWTAPIREARGYDISPSTEKSGTMADRDEEFTYVYTPKPATVVVKHIYDQTGASIIEDKEYHNWKFNDTYTVTEDMDVTEAERLRLNEYTQIGPASVSGKVDTFDGEGNIVVEFIYTKAPARVVVEHVYYDEDGDRQLLSMDTITGESGDSWTSSPWAGADEAGYKLLHTPEPSSGTMKAGTLSIEYTYTKKTGTLEVQYLKRDSRGNLVDFGLTSYSTNVQYGQQVQTVPKTYPEYSQAYGYKVVAVQGVGTSGWNTVKSGETITGYNGTITANKTTVQYIYEVEKVNVTTSYKHQSGADIQGPDASKAKDWVQEYEAFANYETHNDTDSLPPTFYGYEWTGRHPWNSYGKLGAEDVFVNYTYMLKETNLKVNYVDEEGNALANPKERMGLVFEEYSESPISISGYEYKGLKDGSASAEGTLSEEDTVITFVYERAASSVVIRYVDTEGNTLSDPETLNGNYGNPFNASPKTINGWTLVSTQATGDVTIDSDTGLVSGHYSTVKQTVKFIYTRTATKVVVNYIDEETKNSIHEPITINGSVGDSYQATVIDIFGYSYKGTASFSAPLEGTMNDGVSIVTLLYARNAATVTVHFVDDRTNDPIMEDRNGDEVENPVVINGKFGDSYETEPAKIYGWKLTRTPENESGVMINGNIDVTYAYRKVVPTVTYEYVDIEDGHKVSETEVITGETGTRYESKEKDYDKEPDKYPELYGYTLVEIPDNASGIIGEENITVTYKYQKKTRTITVLFVDEEGNEISDAETLADLTVGDYYNTTAKTIYGYDLIEIPENAKGQVTEKAITVTYVYRRAEAVVKVRYVNQDMQEIAEPVTITGNIGDKYETSKKEIEGYKLLSIPTNWSGVMNAKETIVTYIYKVSTATVTTRYINADEQDEVRKFLAENVVNTYPWGSEYTTEAKEFAGMTLIETPENATGIANNPNGEVVDYYYTERDASVTARYVEKGTNKQLAKPVVQTGDVGDAYKTYRKDISGYELDSVDGETEGKLADGNIIVTYYYVPLSAKVIVQYVDMNGNAIAEEETINGHVNDVYDTVQKEIEGYDFKSVTANASGTMTEDVIYVIYTYKAKQSTIAVHHVNEKGKQIADTEFIKCNRNDSYQTSAKEIYGYKLTEVPKNASGRADKDTIEVTYVYQAKDARVSVKYVDKETNEDIAPAEMIEGKVFDEYTTTAKEIEGYTLTKEPANASGTMTEETTVVTYVYEKDKEEEKQDVKVTVKYVDEDGNEISEPDVIDGKEGDSYTTAPKELDGYELVGTPDNAAGTLGKEDIVVIYTYKKAEEPAPPEKEDVKVTIRYEDEDGNEISPPEIIEGKEGDEYTSEPKDIEGYEPVGTPDNATGTLGKEDVEIIYTYKKVDNTSKVVVKYVDKDGNEIAKTEEIKGEIGDEYTAKPVEVDGYKLTETPENATGKITKEVIEVTFVYEKEEPATPENATITVKYVDKNGKAVATSTVITGKIGDDYKAEPKEIKGYKLITTPENATGKIQEGIEVVFVYEKVAEKEDGKVIVKYVDENKKELAKSTTIIGKVGDEYKAKAKTITGYALKTTPKNATGKIAKDEITVTFVYEKEKEVKPSLNVTKKAIDSNGKAITSAKVGDVVKYTVTVSVTGKDMKNVVVNDKFGELTAKTTKTITQASPTAVSTYIIDTSSKTFHSADCKHLNDIKDTSKRKTTRSYSILTKLGYKPASDCEPKEGVTTTTSVVDSKIKISHKNINIVDGKGKQIKAKDIKLSDDGAMSVTLDEVKKDSKITITYNVSLDDKNLAGKKLVNTAVAKADDMSDQTAKSTIQVDDGKPSDNTGTGTGTKDKTNIVSNNGEPTNSKATTGVKTGDAYSIIFVIVAGSLLAGGLSFLFLKKKKH